MLKKLTIVGICFFGVLFSPSGQYRAVVSTVSLQQRKKTTLEKLNIQMVGRGAPASRSMVKSFGGKEAKRGSFPY